MRSKLSREKILRMIEKRDDSGILNFTGCDLSGLDLSELDLHGAVFGTDWTNPQVGAACLKGTRLDKCNLRGASFIHTDLSGVSFFRSDLQNAVLGVADCTDASFKRANLRFANFHGARLENTDFTESDLGNSDFHSAYIGDISLVKARIGNRLLFEDPKGYQAFLAQHKVEEKTAATCFATRFLLAKQTYLALKRVFLNEGEYDRASWAYVKERQMERATHWPPTRAQRCYPDQWDSCQTGKMRWGRRAIFFLRHLYSYFLAWIGELTCGYGEKPSRPVWWALATILVFPVLYWLADGIEATNGATMRVSDYLSYSLAAFSTIGFSNYITSNSLSQFLTSIEALLGIAILALLMFVLGNRISRS